MENKKYITNIKPKARYECLDSLRGICSISLVLFHIFYSYYKSHKNQPFYHGYLGVEFFFLLSGFVTSYAYNDRWNTMSFKEFWKRKFIRLYPLRMLATVLGVCIFYLEDCEDFPLIKSTSYLKLFFITIWALTLIPAPQCFDIRGWGLVNPFN